MPFLPNLPYLAILVGVLIGLVFGDTIRSLPGVRALPL